jgi:formyl-CoA transferase
VLSNQERQWPRLAEVVGLPELVADPRFAEAPARAANAAALIGILDGAFATRPLAEWRAALDAAGITFGIVGTVEEIAADPQARAIGAIRPMAGEEMAVVDSPFSVQGSDKVAARRAPELGADSSAILREAGYGEAEIAALKNSNAVLGT